MSDWIMDREEAAPARMKAMPFRAPHMNEPHDPRVPVYQMYELTSPFGYKAVVIDESLANAQRRVDRFDLPGHWDAGTGVFICTIRTPTCRILALERPRYQ